MSSKNRNVPVKMVRIQWPDKKAPIKHENNVTIGMPKDVEANSAYLRIAVNEKTIISEELNHFQWLDESCLDGIATINSASMKVIIFYETKDSQLRDFFAEMESFLKSKPKKEPLKPPVTEGIDDQI